MRLPFAARREARARAADREATAHSWEMRRPTLLAERPAGDPLSWPMPGRPQQPLAHAGTGQGGRIMSFYDYLASRQVAAGDYPFYALIMAAMRQADTANYAALRQAFPEVEVELRARYNAPGGALTETEMATLHRMEAQ